VSAHPSAGPFHLPAWSQVIADSYGFDAFVLVALDSDGEILAGLPTIEARSPFGKRRWVSLPFTDYCPPLARGGVDAPEAMRAFREFVLAGPAGGIQIRAGLPESEDVYPVSAGYIHRLDVPRDPADLHPHKRHRSSRNSAIHRGVKITIGNTPEELATFYRLHTLTRRKHGVPVQPRRFFDLLQERLIARGNGVVATATLDGEVRAAAVYLQYNGALVAKYHASDPSLPPAGAGHLLEWEMLVYACAQGFRTFDVGRTDADAEGLRLYKNGWGLVESPLTYTTIAHSAPAAALSVGELPKLIIRNSPLWVCRAAGEVLYRWTA
jgi:CelD/BcsL family acetyltransferase involved in cellulose biosynthesis